jgi:hypothetical protein
MGKMAEPRSPRVVSASWGELEIEGIPRVKDGKLWPGGARQWDWNETGTNHQPGVQPADVEELVARGARVVVIGQGMYGRLQVMAETVQWLADRGVELRSLPTPEAVQEYNRLAESRPVGALLHSTC